MARRSTRKSRLSPKRRHAPGTAPGTLSAPPDAARPLLHVMWFDGETFEERSIQNIAELAKLRRDKRTLWVDVQGVGDADVVRQIGETFGLHVLSLEDVMNLHQRPKVEPYADYVFCVLRMPELNASLRLEQLSIFFGKNFVVTFQEDPGDPLDPVRERLRSNRGRIKSAGADYLAYSIIDAVVDRYFPVLELFADRIDELEDEVITSARPGILSALQKNRRELLLLRRAVWPLREMIGNLAREERSDLVRPATLAYLRDCQDHAAQLVDVLESCRELSNDLFDAYHSSVALRTNDVMRVLTIFSTLFTPLTFIAGVYGMNFDGDASPLNMPELRWYYGYPAILLAMSVTAGGLLLFFRRKGWLGSGAHQGSN